MVWYDDNGSLTNEFDTGDEPAENIEVRLYEAYTDAFIEKQTTDPFGRYLFQEIPAGTYYVEFRAPSNAIFIAPNAATGNDDEMDSDAVVMQFDAHRARTHDIILGKGDVDLSVDAGLIEATVLAATDVTLDVRWDKASERNKLDWTTRTEVNTDYFTIERSIDNVDNFTEIGEEEASTNSSSELTYLFDDTDIIGSGTYYYRLKLYDLDGSFEYSNVAVAEVEFDQMDNQTIKLEAYPNPVINEINIDLTTEFDSKVDGGIYDAIGQLIKPFEKDQVQAGLTSMKMDISELPSGTYLLRMQIGKQVIFEKITKAQ